MEEHFYEHYSKGDLKLQEAERTLTGTRVVFLIESDRDSCKIQKVKEELQETVEKTLFEQTPPNIEQLKQQLEQVESQI